MDKVTAALLLTAAVHVIAVVVLFWALLDGRSGWRDWWPGGDDGRGPGPDAPAPEGPRGGDGLPLPDALPAGVRLRTEHERLAGRRHRVRRPAREPEPARLPAER